jgi:NAD(P)-dependent dehydrogenase (short-subunit alcohol dehydrogenase family)
MNGDRKVVIVTGGTWGAGRGLVARLVREGYQVVGCGTEKKEAGSVAEKGIAATHSELSQRGLEADLRDVDVSNESQVTDLIDSVVKQYGSLYGLVNNAAIHPTGTILETTTEIWDRVIDVNLKGIYFTCKAAIPYMIKHGGGSIVNIGSGSQWGKPNLLAYCASKGGVMALSMSLAYDHLADKVRVNVVTPGGMLGTGMTDDLIDDPDFAKLMAAAMKKTAAGRSVTGSDIAGAVNYFLSPDSEVVTGTVLDIGCFSHQGGPIPRRG